MNPIWKVADLAGSRVETEEGRFLGILEDVLPTHGNDVYVVKDADKEILIPALKSVVLSVSVPEKKIVVRLPEGLEDVYTQKI